MIILLALNASLVGLALTYVISLNGLFQYCVRVSAEVESLVSTKAIIVIIFYALLCRWFQLRG